MDARSMIDLQARVWAALCDAGADTRAAWDGNNLAPGWTYAEAARAERRRRHLSALNERVGAAVEALPEAEYRAARMVRHA